MSPTSKKRACKNDNSIGVVATVAADDDQQLQTRKSRKCRTNSTKQYLTSIADIDILLGRGKPIQKRLGNRIYRDVVDEHKKAYKNSSKHAVKDRIARTVLRTLTSKGARFVRKIETVQERRLLKVDEKYESMEVWVVISDELVLLKVKQALREKADLQKK